MPQPKIPEFLFETASLDAKRLHLDYFGFGKYGKNGVVTHTVVHKELVPVKKKIDFAPKSFKRIQNDLLSHVSSIQKEFSLSKEEVMVVSKHPVVNKMLNVIRFKVETAANIANKSLKTMNVLLKSVAKEIHKTKPFQAIRKGTLKIQEFLDKYPVLKKIAGVTLAGFMIYQWQNMAFSGDLDDDYDVSDIFKAIKGDYTIVDLLGTPEGLRGMAQLFAGLAIGVTFPWGVILPATFKAAMVYTAAKKLNNPKTIAKIKEIAEQYKIKMKGI